MVKGNDGLMYMVDGGKICIWDGFRATPLPMPQTKETEGLGAERFILKDNLIFITYTDALSVYNRTTKQYIVYSQNATDTRYVIKSNSGTEFFKDHTGQMYIKAGALYKVNEDLSVTEYKQLSQQLKDKILTIDNTPYEDNEYNLWLNCRDSKLIKLTKNKTIERYYNLLQLNQNSYRLYQDTKGRYWLYCWFAGLQLFDTATGNSKIVNRLLGDIVVKDMCEWKDNNGNNWIICATDKGLRLLNPTTFEVKCYNRDHSKKIAKAKNEGEPFKLLVDDENILWITNDGSNNEFIAPARQQFTNFSLTTNYHFSTIPFAPRANGNDDIFPNRICNPDSNIWIGALFGKGVSVFNKQMQFITNYPNYTKVKDDTSNAFENFNSIKNIDEKNALAATNEFVCVWDKKNKITRYKDEFSVNEKGKYRSPNFKEIIEYNKNKWLIKASEYIYLFDYNKNKLSRWFSLKDSSILSTSPKQLRNFNFTKTGLWILYETAILQYDTALHKITQLYSFEKKGKYFFPESSAIKFVEDANGNLWIAGSQGLIYFDPHTKEMSSLKNKNNLPNVLTNIVIDKQQRLWLLSGSDIVCYNIALKKSTAFKGSGALSSADGYGIFIDSSNNNIWVAANKYLTVFNADSVLKKQKTSPLFISEIIQGNSSINFDAKAANYFKIPYDKSSVTFHVSFTGFNFVNEPLIAFRLNNKDDWKYSNTGSFTFYNLGAGKYNLQVAAAFSIGDIQNETFIIVPFTITPPFYKSIWFIALILTLLGTITYVFFKYRLIIDHAKANEKEKAAHLLQVKTELEKRLAESEMASLQSQMNPHFIFNVLNSINKYILTSDVHKASEYLVSFSKLIRLVLENSKVTKVALQSDLDALQLYINLEKMRFEDKFESAIEVDKSIDTQFLMIPPLIIQPYAENAIWHGLLQKDGDNKLMIHITQPEANILLITITDDGIGRKKALELKSKSASQNKSFGMQITKNRIGIVNKLFDQQTSVGIEDLYDDNGNATGTKVSLRLLV